MKDDLFGSWVAGGNPVKGRVKDDFYETPELCTSRLLDEIKFPKTIDEPACGKGAISRVLESRGHKVVSSDIVDRGYGQKKDFMSFDKRESEGLITNPPFFIADKFIEKAHELEYDVFALLLKSQYWHSQKRFDLFNKITPSFILPMTWRPDFSGGGSPTMDCIWCVWHRGSTQTIYRPLRKNQNTN